jgi:hypothetical protein
MHSTRQNEASCIDLGLPVSTNTREKTLLCLLLVHGATYRISNSEKRKMGGVVKGNLFRSKVANKKWYKLPYARGIFASSMQNRQLVCLKGIPINNRKDTPTIPLHGLRAQREKENKMPFDISRYLALL